MHSANIRYQDWRILRDQMRDLNRARLVFGHGSYPLNGSRPTAEKSRCVLCAHDARGWGNMRSGFGGGYPTHQLFRKKSYFHKRATAKQVVRKRVGVKGVQSEMLQSEPVVIGTEWKMEKRRKKVKSG